jgi:hypothetical protein
MGAGSRGKGDMNFGFLHLGMAGALEAGAISLLVGVVLHGLAHAFGRHNGWSHAGEIGWAYVGTLLASASVDMWNLLYMGIVPLDSPVVIRRILSGIHDPDMLGVRVICEIAGAAFGVMLGWLLWTGALRRHLASSRGDRRDAG